MTSLSCKLDGTGGPTASKGKLHMPSRWHWESPVALKANNAGTGSHGGKAIIHAEKEEDADGVMA